MKTSKTRSKLAIVLAMTLPLVGCVTTTGSGGTKVACVGFKPVKWSVDDTDDTILQVKAHNAAWKAVCEGRYE